jgi:ATP-dependent RNA helicase RhlE
MASFEQFDLKKPLRNALNDLGFDTPTAIQEQAYSVVLSGKDVLGIAQTGTGKTLAYSLPILTEHKFSKDYFPRTMILVPTRELVIQVVKDLEELTKYMNCRVLGIYGGGNIKRQRVALAEGTDIVVATPGRIYDLALDQSMSLKGIKKLVIDEVDVMLDLGFRYQLSNILELLPERRQNIMFSATMTDHVEALIDDFFVDPKKISIAVSGTPLDNISQTRYDVPNFHTKVNLLQSLLVDQDEFKKVLVFTSNKKMADRLFEEMDELHGDETCVIHSNKSQNYRIRSIEEFDEGQNRILISTDIMSRGLDLEKITHVINFDTPAFPENYMHRIGRTGRAEKEGNAILFSTEKEQKWREGIEELMNYKVPVLEMPSEVQISTKLIPEEQPEDAMLKNPDRNMKFEERGASTHEKKAKNQKTNQGGSYKRNIKKKYKKAQTRGDKTYHKRQKRG